MTPEEIKQKLIELESKLNAQTERERERERERETSFNPPKNFISFLKYKIISILQGLSSGFKFGIGILAAFITVGLLAVAVNTLTTFTSGTSAKASEVNANFTAIKTAIEGIPNWTKSGTTAMYSDGNVSVSGKVSSSNLGTYCGLSSSTFTGNMGGYTAVKSTCATTCGNSNAHMCSAHEVSISSQQGLLPASFGWYSGGVNAVGDSSLQHTDCKGWTSASSTIRSTLLASLFISMARYMRSVL